MKRVGVMEYWNIGVLPVRIRPITPQPHYSDRIA
jgi:hypothetical protein